MAKIANKHPRAQTLCNLTNRANCNSCVSTVGCVHVPLLLHKVHMD